MKTFRTVKARQLTKRNAETNHAYIFAIDKDISAEYQGNFSQADEDWMLTLTTKVGGSLLRWTNMPEGVRKLAEGKTKITKISEIPSIGKADVIPEFHIGRSKSEIDAELSLAKLTAERELANRAEVTIVTSELEKLQNKYNTLEEDYRILVWEHKNLEGKLSGFMAAIDVSEDAEIIEDTKNLEVIIEPLKVDEPVRVEDSVNLAMFKTEYAKKPRIAKFINAMKLEFGVEELTEIATELGLEYDGTKSDMIKLFVTKLGE